VENNKRDGGRDCRRTMENGLIFENRRKHKYGGVNQGGGGEEESKKKQGAGGSKEKG